MATIPKESLATSSLDVWLIDSSSSHHMTSNLSIFKGFYKSYSSKVKIGDGRLVDIKGKCVISVMTL